MRRDLYIRDYARIRKVLGKIYIYGFYSRTDFEGLNKNTYDKESLRLYELFGPESLKTVTRSKRKYLQFRRRYFESMERGLYRTYLIKSYSARDLELAAILLSLLAKSRDGLSLTAAFQLTEQFFQGSDAQLKSTVRRRLLEFCEAGYIRREGTLYRLNDCLFEGLPRELLERLHGYLGLCVQAFSPRVAGCCLKGNLERYLGVGSPPGDAFLVRHGNYHNIPDEEILYRLLDCCLNGRTARLRCRLPEAEGEQTVEVCPVKARLDAKLGRWYLLALRDGCPAILRVSDIFDVRPGAPMDYEACRNSVDAAFEHSLISFRRQPGAPFLLELELCFQAHPWQKAQFLREMPCGEVSCREGRQIYTVWINDPVELLPWLRCYSADIRFLRDDYGLRAMLLEDLREMLHRDEAVP